MNRVLAVIWQFGLAVAGYGLAALSAGAFLHLALNGGLEPTGRGTVWIDVTVILFATLYVGYFAFVPAIAAIAVAEFLARRDWLSHALGGMAVAFAGAAIHAGAADIDVQARAGVLPVIAAAGLVAGLVYWLVAGRRSGLWRAETG